MCAGMRDALRTLSYRDQRGRMCAGMLLREKAGILSAMHPLIVVAATKGGVGKTTLAYEIAAALDAVLVDLDWDSGGATRMWGIDPLATSRSVLLDALERGPEGATPRVRSRAHQPSLLPGHPDLSASRIADGLVAECLQAWGSGWDRPVVVDTHPGANPLTDGALMAADLTVVPVVLATRELDALEGMVRDFAQHRLLLAPNLVPPHPPRGAVGRLTSIAGAIPVAPPISDHRWIRRRVRRSAIVLQANPGAAIQRARAEFQALAEVVKRHAEQ